MLLPQIGFIGGGNMSTAILGGLLRQGHSPESLLVIDPDPTQCQKLMQTYGIQALTTPPSSLLNSVDLLVWAVKPQQFRLAASSLPAWPQTLHLSVMAGIRSQDIATLLQTDRVVRTMPNTPALIGLGITGAYARPRVAAEDKVLIEQVLAPTGELMWVREEHDLDAITALSGSGPAYVFYFLEAMVEAAVQMGLAAEQGRRLALATFKGATELAQRAAEDLPTLRAKVTSKGGTTYAALQILAQQAVKEHFVQAMQAAKTRAQELGEEFKS